MVDPIINSGSGISLIQADVEAYFKTHLLPKTDILTPNAIEAQKITGMPIEDIGSIHKMFDRFVEMGCASIVLKGGHIHPIDTEIVDYLYDQGQFDMFIRQREIGLERVHGTGCIFSAILLAQLAHTEDLYNAMNNTEEQMDSLFRNIFELPSRELTLKGGQVLDFGLTPAKIAILNEVAEVYEFIKTKKKFDILIPEVRMNISIGIANAKTVEDVAAIEGRITKVNNIPTASGPIKFGASNHTARLLLTAQQKDASIRAVMNFKYEPDFIQPLAKAGLYLFEIQREDQPQNVQNQEKSTMQWVIETSFAVVNRIPDIIWDKGEVGKEPMMRLFGKDGADLIEKLKIIIRTVLD
jgi:hydroxymethylpyrimidine/phosphomethylpyrimidine kinase